MGRSYKVTAPPQNSKAKFGLLFLGNFRQYDIFKKAMLGKKVDGHFVYIEAGEKHFLEIKNGQVVDEEVRGYGEDAKGAENRGSDIEDRDLPGEPDPKNETSS